MANKMGKREAKKEALKIAHSLIVRYVNNCDADENPAVLEALEELSLKLWVVSSGRNPVNLSTKI